MPSRPRKVSASLTSSSSRRKCLCLLLAVCIVLCYYYLTTKGTTGAGPQAPSTGGASVQSGGGLPAGLIHNAANQEPGDSRHQKASSRKSWRLVHQQQHTWQRVEAIPPRLTNWMLSWRACMHGWNYRLWSDADTDLMVRRATPWFHATYNKLTSRREKFAVARYVYMLVYGGVYADLDSRCLRSFEHVVTDCGVALSSTATTDLDSAAASMQQQELSTSFLFSKPGHQLWIQLLRLIHGIVWHKHNAGSNPAIRDLADPALLTHIVQKTLHTYKDGGSNSRVCVMPPEYFSAPTGKKRLVSSAAASSGGKLPVPVMGAAENCKPWNRMSDEDLTRCESANINAYVLHLPADGGNT